MQITQVLLSTLAAASAVMAAPAETSKNMMASSPQWTIRNLKRQCNGADTTCTWSFGVQVGGGATKWCNYVVNGNDASEANGGPSGCGVYTITSGWSGQFGPGNGFTTLSVVNNDSRQIVWPAYTDSQLAGGHVVKPDQSYSPAALP
ncbi:hypothetical protein N7533_010924 [Penicillium manginii]|jgi:hypothetical protein|uniref:uncharacterized protein n=1 Tax=Penicillium manginii TaxID=203109 RepID=UPI0025475A54|nr:uncharacterized protein N7533_010924 [Penicillium manginii]KAJ5741515.1 hypothetical protein N7533_010924 [Penicillium manginii]